MKRVKFLLTAALIVLVGSLSVLRKPSSQITQVATATVQKVDTSLKSIVSGAAAESAVRTPDAQIVLPATVQQNIPTAATVSTVKPTSQAPQQPSSHAVLAKLGQDYGITVTTSLPRSSLPFATWQAVGAADEAELAVMTTMLDQEFRKYPVDFIRRSNLKHIFLVKKLYVDGIQYRAAMPDPFYDEAVYYDIGADYVLSSGGSYMRNVIHHEFGHVLEHNVYGDYAWNDRDWKTCNQPDFTYGGGGYLAYSDPSFATKKNPIPGFITGYGTYGIEEDKAEFYAELFTNYDGLTALASRDSRTLCKLNLYQGYLQTMSPSLTAAYLNARS
jgi:hypothetical protein